MDESLHVLGNGRLMVGLKGLDVYDFKPTDGASLFSAAHYRVTENGYEPVVSEHKRIPGRAEYIHTLKEGTVREFVTVNDCFVREFSLSAPVVMKVETKPLVVTVGDNVMCVKKGSPFINDYPTAQDAYFRLSGTGISVDFPYITMRGNGKLVVKLSDVPDADDTPGDIWSPEFPGLKREVPEEIRRSAEDFYFLMQSYRADCGGYVSAVEWNMGYVRDLYGASRGMLAAGWYPMVKEILAFFRNGFEKNGFLATAYTLDGLYTPHIHECDRAENTGYIVLLLFEYLKVTGDREFFEELLPFARSCVREQSEVCFGGMLPFSGDETYVAGGMLPKVHIDDGSAEATMLFIKSAELMAPYMKGDGALDKAKEAAAAFRDNFVRDGRLITNNPERRKIAAFPPSKHGCCIYCYNHRDITPNEFGLYRCAECAAKPQADVRDGRIYELPCVGMEPVFFGSNVLTEKEQLEFFERLAEQTLANGYFESELKNTGYEFGLLLYGLTLLGSRYAQKAAEFTLSMRDEEGVWAEYYFGAKPSGMRWRSWETGVNLCALMKFCEKKSCFGGNGCEK